MRIYELFENDDTVTLYRGDASKISEFTTSATEKSIGLLFGTGIYLTDNPQIAVDYTIKGGEHIIDGFASEIDAYRTYIRDDILNNTDWKNISNTISDDEIKQAFIPYLKAAKERFKKNNLRTFKDTSGEWSIIKNDHAGIVSHFEIPRSYRI